MQNLLNALNALQVHTYFDVGGGDDTALMTHYRVDHTDMFPGGTDIMGYPFPEEGKALIIINPFDFTRVVRVTSEPGLGFYHRVEYLEDTRK